MAVLFRSSYPSKPPTRSLRRRISKRAKAAAKPSLDEAQFQRYLSQLLPRFTPEELSNVVTMQNDPSVCFELFNWASQQLRFRHNVSTYHIIIKKLGAAKMYEEMDDVVNQVLAIASIGSEALYNTMIYFFTENRKLTRAGRKIKVESLDCGREMTQGENGLIGFGWRNVLCFCTMVSSTLKAERRTDPSDSSKKPPKSKITSASPSNALVPLHQPVTGSNRSSRIGGDNPSTSGGSKIHSFNTPSKSQASPSLYLAPSTALQTPSVKTSPGLEQLVATPWSSKRGSSNKEITTEEKLEQFLADIGNKISESASKLATPPPTVNGFGIASPSSANISGTTRSTPLRPVRMSPGSQKFNTPPKKGEGELPPPMSMEESIEAFASTGIYPQIEQWRDRLRQWFSSVLLNPLLNKVMQAAAKLGISITINHVGSDLPNTGTASTASPIERTNEWQPASSALHEESLLHQLHATLVQALDASMSRLPLGHFHQSPQQAGLIPILQECIDTITEHQRLRSLMKGEWVKGLLPQSSVRADYTSLLKEHV
ncbi:hypothetical protein LguiB_012381 [Lonicera macranthoides]